MPETKTIQISPVAHKLGDEYPTWPRVGFGSAAGKFYMTTQVCFPEKDTIGRVKDALSVLARHGGFGEVEVERDLLRFVFILTAWRAWVVYRADEYVGDYA